MPANSARVRITVWLRKEEYDDMHALAAELEESHADFFRRAVVNEARRIRTRGEARKPLCRERRKMQLYG